MTDAPAAADPRGFHVMMPRGWVRYLIDDEGKRALLAQASGRMRELSRPDLDAQARTMIESYWRTLKANRIAAVYLPSDPDGGGAPLSIAVKQHAAAPGSAFAESLPSLAAGAPIETFETPIGTVLRWIKDSRGAGELDGVRSRQIGYGFPLPGERDRRGMVFLASIAHLGDSDPANLEILTETADTIMETFRWR